MRTRIAEKTGHPRTIQRSWIVIAAVVGLLVAGVAGWYARDGFGAKRPVTVTDTFDATVGELGDAGNGVLSGCVTRTDNHHDVCGAFTVVGPAVHKGDTVHAALERYDNGRSSGELGFYFVVLYPDRLDR